MLWEILQEKFSFHAHHIHVKLFSKLKTKHLFLLALVNIVKKENLELKTVSSIYQWITSIWWPTSKSYIENCSQTVHIHQKLNLALRMKNWWEKETNRSRNLFLAISSTNKASVLNWFSSSCHFILLWFRLHWRYNSH